MTELPAPLMPALRRLGQRGSALWQQWRALPCEPLLITAELVEGYLAAEGTALHLDGLLAWAALELYDQPQTLQDAAWVIPLPLQVLGLLSVEAAGARLPLWASSNLLPAEAWRPDRRYWHKRYPIAHADWASRVAAPTNLGRWKDRRVPARVILTERLQAVCLGHRATIEELLGAVTHVGKRVAAGYGRVRRWLVQPLPVDESHALELILRHRPVPVAYHLAQGGVPLDRVTRPLCGWTPPYWYAPWHLPCLDGQALQAPDAQQPLPPAPMQPWPLEDGNHAAN